MPKESTDMSFSLIHMTPASLKQKVCSFLKRIVYLPLDMYVKHCKSFMSLLIL